MRVLSIFVYIKTAFCVVCVCKNKSVKKREKGRFLPSRGILCVCVSRGRLLFIFAFFSPLSLFKQRKVCS